MKVVHYDNPEAFYARIEPYLLADEATHNLLFGLLSNIRHDPARFPEAVMALVEDQRAVQIVVLRTNIERDLVLSLAQQPEAIPLLAEDLFGGGMALLGVNGPSDVSRAFADAWSGASGQANSLKLSLRTFKLEKIIPVAEAAGHLRRATLDDRDLLVEWEIAFEREAFPDEDHDPEEAKRAIDFRLRSDTSGLYVWDDGGAVCYAGYGGPTPHGIRVGPVYTPPELRGRGYASACVAGMSQLLLDSGREFCFLFTNLANATANHIYQAMGYQPVCDFTVYVFGD